MNLEAHRPDVLDIGLHFDAGQRVHRCLGVPAERPHEDGRSRYDVVVAKAAHDVVDFCRDLLVCRDPEALAPIPDGAKQRIEVRRDAGLYLGGEVTVVQQAEQRGYRARGFHVCLHDGVVFAAALAAALVLLGLDQAAGPPVPLLLGRRRLGGFGGFGIHFAQKKVSKDPPVAGFIAGETAYRPRTPHAKRAVCIQGGVTQQGKKHEERKPTESARYPSHRRPGAPARRRRPPHKRWAGRPSGRA